MKHTFWCLARTLMCEPVSAGITNSGFVRMTPITLVAASHALIYSSARVSPQFRFHCAAEAPKSRTSTYKISCFFKHRQLLLAPLMVALFSIYFFVAVSAANAQAVTWTKTDINTGSTGSYTYTPGTPPQFTISGTGTGVGFFDDSFVFVGTPAFSSLTLQARVASQTNTGAGALAGLCIRNSIQSQYAVSVRRTASALCVNNK